VLRDVTVLAAQTAISKLSYWLRVPSQTVRQMDSSAAVPGAGVAAKPKLVPL
jgi:hypothetical protein